MSLQVKTKFIEDQAVNDLKILLRTNQYLKSRNNADSADVDLLKLNASDAIEFATTPVVGANDVLTSDLLGANNGIAELDATGKIPASQLTVDALQYLGTYNASTNTPTLADGTGTNGDLYRVSVAGTQDLGSGNIEFSVGDKVVYNGATWEKWDDTPVSNASELVYDQTTASDWTVATGSTVEATLDEVGSRLTAVEGSLGSNNGNEIFTLDGTDITNGYVDLAQTPLADSIMIAVDGMPGLAQKTTHFTVSTNRITWAGDLATLLASGDVVNIFYEYA